MRIGSIVGAPASNGRGGAKALGGVEEGSDGVGAPRPGAERALGREFDGVVGGL